MWFQAAECNAVNASLLLNLINNNFLIVIFLTENLPILNPYYPKNPKIYDPIYPSNSIENATLFSRKSPLASCKGVPTPLPGGY